MGGGACMEGGAILSCRRKICKDFVFSAWSEPFEAFEMIHEEEWQKNILSADSCRTCEGRQESCPLDLALTKNEPVILHHFSY